MAARGARDAPLVAAVNAGTTGARAIAYDLQGRQVGEVRYPYRISSPRPGWAEQDARDWAESAAAALRGLAGRARTAGRIRAIGLTGQCPSMVPVRRALRPAAAGHAVPRQPGRRRSARDAQAHRGPGHAPADRAHRRGISRRPEGALAAPARARCLRPHQAHPAAAGRGAAPAHRAGPHRRDTRERHAVLQPPRACLGCGAAGRVRHRSGPVPARPAALADGGRTPPAHRGRTRSRRGHTGGHRRRRQPVRGRRGRRHRSWPGQRDGRGVLLPELRRARAAARSPGDALQPCRPRPLLHRARREHHRRRDQLGGQGPRLRQLRGTVRRCAAVPAAAATRRAARRRPGRRGRRRGGGGGRRPALPALSGRRRARRPLRPGRASSGSPTGTACRNWPLP